MGLGRCVDSVAHRRWQALAFFLSVAVALLVPLSSQAQDALKGVALVIGNGDYQHLPKLANPDHDARDVGKLLNELGFDTVITSDRDARRLSRDLTAFVEDAEGADVALLYYAGHGIEAGGENFLVPIDADLSALDAAGERLVPLSAFVERLKATVPVTIVMLDACRNNPFPPGALIRLDPAAKAAPIASAGLGGSRGAAPLSKTAQGTESFGTVLAFSAEPGRAALDGAAGMGGPYAAAVLRHLGAMNGEEFGTVMRMVAEEVYLKTGGKQRPWVNENLRRLLYFGAASISPTGEEGDILAERRQLLLTIAVLPDFDRARVERVAADGGVPMDALYGMLGALGRDTPSDPAELDRLLRAQTEKLKELIAERAALRSTDGEIVRLSALADKAIDEGALNTALRLLERAKARVGELEKTVDEAEADIGSRRIEFAEVYARSAETYTLAFDHLKAAEDYEHAFRQVERWDDQLAWEYRDRELLSLLEQDNIRGDNGALEKAISLGQETLRLTSLSPSRHDWAATQNNLANALLALGQREPGTTRLEQAVGAYRAALDEYAIERAALDQAITEDERSISHKDAERESGAASVQDAFAVLRLKLRKQSRDQAALDWAMIGNNLGYALRVLGERVSGTAWLEEAVTAHRAVLKEQQRDRAPLDWAYTQDNLGNALSSLGKRESGTARLEEAVAAYRSALEEYTRDRVPLDWALTTSNLANVLQTLGERESGTARLEEAAAAYRDALQEQRRDRVPLIWARTQANLGDALLRLGEGESGTARLEEAIAAYRSALEEYARDRVPLDWAATQNNLGYALRELGDRESGTAHLEEAVAAFRAALEERARDQLPLDWAMTQNNLGNALQTLGKRESGTARLEQAVTAYRSALEEYTRDRMPLQWAKTGNNLGGTLVELGRRSHARARVDEGRRAIQSAWDMYREAGYGQYDDYFARRLAEAERVLAETRLAD